MSRETRRLLTVGFLTVVLGFLTNRAPSTPLNDELTRLDRLEAHRDRVLAREDSLGGLIATMEVGDRKAARIFAEAEKLAVEAREVNLELLLTRDRCRSLAQSEWVNLDRVDPSGAAFRENALKGLLEGRLNQPPEGEFVLVEPDSSDGYETLLDKQAYLKDLRDRIVILDNLSGERAERLQRERSLLRANAGFIDDSRFLDEGGRVGSGNLFMQQPGSPPPDDPGHARPTGAILGTGREDEPLSAAPSESTSIGSDLGRLRVTRERLQRDLSRVDVLLAETLRLLGRFEGFAP